MAGRQLADVAEGTRFDSRWAHRFELSTWLRGGPILARSCGRDEHRDLFSRRYAVAGRPGWVHGSSGAHRRRTHHLPSTYPSESGVALTFEVAGEAD